MDNVLSILFYLMRSKKDKNGLIPIYLRVTLNGKRVDLSTHRKINPLDWDVDASCAIGTGVDARILNNYLDNLKSKVNKQFNILESLGEPYSVEDIKNRLSGKSEKKKTLVNIFRYHNDEMKLKAGKDVAIGTYKHYLTSLKILQEFLAWQYNKKDIALEDLNHSFITRFESYLKSVQKCGHNTSMKHIKRMKKVVNMALANEWLLRDPFMKYKCTYKPVNRGYLTAAELLLLEEKEFKIPRLQKALDIFLFCCYTGLSWSDISALTDQDINTGIDGEKWIVIYRKKTNTRSPIPILPQAQAIINKYKDDPEAIAKGRLLPVNSNQRMNGYLKEIADICGINKNLTMHLARHTFATTVTLANGVPIETVSKMLGHTSIKTTQIYSKVVDSKISEDMQALKGKLTPAKEKIAI